MWKDCTCNCAICNCENGKYSASLFDISVTIWDGIINVEEKESLTTNFNEKKAISKTLNFYISLLFLLITLH